MRPTLADIAREAGVSAATVDRVMNDRPGVRAGMKAHVEGVARRLGYLMAETAAGKPVHLRLLLPEGTNAFINGLAMEAETQAAGRAGVTLRIDRFDAFDPGGLAGRLRALKGNVDGVALVALDHPAVREAIRSLAQTGTHVVTIASDITQVPRLAYLGIDNGQAGRLAGYVMGRFIGRERLAKVALFAGSLSYRGHQEREMGFRQVLAEEFPEIEILELREVQEDRQRAADEVSALLTQHPDLAGLYNAGGATAGIARALQASGAGPRVVFLAHEATEGNKALLLDGTLDAVIDQNPRVEIREALNALVHAAREEAYTVVPPRLQVIFRENLPEW